jgi:hypothetical protein
MDKKKKWYRQKTTWAAILSIAGAAGGVATGDLALADALQVISTGAIGMFLRQGVENKSS